MEAIKGIGCERAGCRFRAWLLDVVVVGKPLEDNDVIDSQHIPVGYILIIPTRTAPAGWRLQRLYSPITCVMRWLVSRPRVSRMGEGRSLRCAGINGSTDERPDQLVAMRLYIWTSDSLCLPVSRFWRWTMWSVICRRAPGRRLRRLVSGCAMR